MQMNEKSAGTLSRREKLYTRQRITDTIRNWFRAEGFLEADVPLLVSGTTPDPFIQSFEVDGKYLTTSTEYQIKRMAAAGF
jgi:elongation factor P--beta-lysine ligase